MSAKTVFLSHLPNKLEIRGDSGERLRHLRPDLQDRLMFSIQVSCGSFGPDTELCTHYHGLGDFVASTKISSVLVSRT